MKNLLNSFQVEHPLLAKLCIDFWEIQCDGSGSVAKFMRTLTLWFIWLTKWTPKSQQETDRCTFVHGSTTMASTY